ncbi:MAG: DUF1223 domain-containing protein [Pseudomonadota bacterium]
METMPCTPRRRRLAVRRSAAPGAVPGAVPVGVGTLHRIARAAGSVLRAAGLALGLMLPAAPALAGSPMLVELFTSQGCSSCPPADETLSRLADREDIVALSFHVDYWDYLGWRDTFADPVFTKRQFDYRDTWGERVVYTPQMVVGGDRPVVGSRRGEVEAALADGRETGGQVTLKADGGPLMAAFSGVPGLAEIWVARFVQASTVEIERGENRGRTITYRNVVRDLMRMGTVKQVGAGFAVPQPSPGEGVAVWAQAKDLGMVYAVGRYEIPVSTAAAN